MPKKSKNQSRMSRCALISQRPDMPLSRNEVLYRANPGNPLGRESSRKRRLRQIQRKNWIRAYKASGWTPDYSHAEMADPADLPNLDNGRI